MKQILRSNKHTSVLNKVTGTKGKQKQDDHSSKWAKFTCNGKETRFITNPFKNNDVKTTFITNNNIGQLLSVQHTHKQNKYVKSCVYQLTCPKSKKKYIGQTGRPFHVRFREYFQEYKYVNNKSKFAQHLLEGHSSGPIDDIMHTIHIANKGTLERFYIYRVTQRDNQLHDKLTEQSNSIFEAPVQNDPQRAHSTPP